MWKSVCGLFGKLFGSWVFGFENLFGFSKTVRGRQLGSLSELSYTRAPTLFGFMGASILEAKEIEGKEGGGEEEIAHELGFDGEAIGVGEAERAVGAAGTEECGFAGEATGIEQRLDKAKEAYDGGADKEGAEKANFEARRGF